MKTLKILLIIAIFAGLTSCNNIQKKEGANVDEALIEEVVGEMLGEENK